MALDISKFIGRFIGEARDHLTRLEAGLAALETQPDDAEAINALFRSAHTIKGSARMIKLLGISANAHRLEDLLGALRAGTRRPESVNLGLLLRGVDAIAAQLDQVEASGGDPPADEALCRALAQAAGLEEPAAAGSLAAAVPATPLAPATAEPAAASAPLAASAQTFTAEHPDPTARATTPQHPASTPQTTPPGQKAATAPIVTSGQTIAPGQTTSPGAGTLPGQGAETASSAATSPATVTAQTAAPTPSPTTATPSPAAPTASYRAPDSVRVPLAKLDELVRLIGEVLSVQARLRQRLLEVQTLDRTAQAASNQGAPGLDPDLSAALRRFTRDLRDTVQAQELLTVGLGEQALVLRMLPLSMVFDPSARMVRELARAAGKEVRCEVQGGEIELDRQIIERLGDALVHLVRNAVDHGLDDPAERLAAGKPAVGRVCLSARHAGGGVLVEVSDDGRGLNRERLIAKAVHKGLLDPARAATLTDEEVWELIYEPGLSTSDIITDLSGRGVGMDVIRRTVIDELHGALSLVSHPGEGSRFTFNLPLSLALMRVLLFTSGGHRFGLAAQQVVELIRVTPGETIQVAGRPAVVLRNEFIPLVPLAELLGLETHRPGPRGRGARLAVIIGVRQAKLGLLIDDLEDARDMVIKSLPGQMRGCGLVSGIVVTGDQALVSVLQAPGLLDLARRYRGETTTRGTAQTLGATPRKEPWRVLVVDDSLNTREIIKEVLEAYGYRVTTAEDGLDGWQKALGGRYNAILTDVEMPGLDGFSLTARLRAHAQYETTPIIIITSREQEEDKRRGVQVGADAYIVKGDFDQSSLLDTLHTLLGDP
jgi:two-component system chemotaxis sensor kinase CheA